MTVAIMSVACTAATAAPLMPLSGFADLAIHGQANVNADWPIPMQTEFQASETVTNWTDTEADISSFSMTGDVPGFEHSASTSAAAGVYFEQPAYNEYILSLNSQAGGDVMRGLSPIFYDGHYTADSSIHLEAAFLVEGLPRQHIGDPSTIIFELAHFGSIFSMNNGLAANHVSLSVFDQATSQYFDYQQDLVSPFLPPNGFQHQDFYGLRDWATAGTLTTEVGSIIELSIDFDSHAMGQLLDSNPHDIVGSDSDFFCGLDLHVTVLPEPTSLTLLGLAGLFLARRRKVA